MTNSLHKNILSTIIYYDIFNYPLTAFEVWKYFGVFNNQEKAEADKEIGLGEVIYELDGKELKGRIEQFQGFYFLPGRKSLVEKRLENNKLSEQKFKITKKAVFWLRFLPYVRMVAVTGTVAMKNAGKNSDLDLLIVLKHGRIFLGRTLVTGAVHFMGRRRYGKKIANRICLNCFLTEASLESRLRDLFSASEYFFIVPLFGQKTFLEFQSANKWIKTFKNNFEPDAAVNAKAFPEYSAAYRVRNILESVLNLSMFNFLENRLEKWQTERIANDPRTKEAGSIIMADASALIFFHRAHSLVMEKLLQKRLNEGAFD